MQTYDFFQQKLNQYDTSGQSEIIFNCCYMWSVYMVLQRLSLEVSNSNYHVSVVSNKGKHNLRIL